MLRSLATLARNSTQCHVLKNDLFCNVKNYTNICLVFYATLTPKLKICMYLTACRLSQIDSKCNSWGRMCEQFLRTQSLRSLALLNVHQYLLCELFGLIKMSYFQVRYLKNVARSLRSLTCYHHFMTVPAFSILMEV